MISWEKTARDLNKDENFGSQFEKTSNFKDLWAAFEPTLPPRAASADITKKVLAFVQSSMSWNGEYRVYTKKDLNDAFTQKKGSSAEMNLAVVALLKKAGLDALPVLVSTRNNGKPYEAYPFIEQFNSVLAMVRQGDQHTLLDATHPFLPPGQLQLQHYNNRGWPVVARKESPWIDITAPELAIVWSGSMKLDEQGQLSGSISMTGSNSVAANWRESLSSKTTNDFLKKTFATRYPDAVFDSISVENKDDVEKPLRLKFTCQIPNTANVVNDFIYFNPILDFYVNENPFKSLTREFPINFTYPIKAQYVVDIAIPSGYQIDEMPTSERINMPNKEGSIVFTCDKMEGNKILIILKMTLTKTEYPAEQYDLLRQYFDMIGKKIATQIVLKKL